MIDEGVINLFNKGAVRIPVETAEPLIERLGEKMEILEKDPDNGSGGLFGSHHYYIRDLIWDYLKWAEIKGFNWDTVKGNKNV
jgi:hypothetical protein